MGYDRYDTRDAPRDERSRWSGDRDDNRGWERDERSGRGGGEDRGFFERAGDEIASWFGADDGDRRPREDQTRERGQSGWNSPQRDENRGRGADFGRDRERSAFSSDRDRGFHDRGWERSGGRGYAASERDYNPSWQHENDWNQDRSRSDQARDRGYRPLAGDYGRSEQSFAASGFGRQERGAGDDSRKDRSQSEWARDEYRRSSRAGTSDQSDRSRHEDPHYRSWRDRHVSELDRDYDEYRRENQSRFESDFASWREKRQQKRGLLGQIREHMEVMGSDNQHVGTVDKAGNDRIILTKSDPESGGVHHSLSCSDIDRIEDNKVILGCSAEQARQRWRDESRGRALFERDDQGEMGPRMLDRRFQGTYR